MLLDLLLRYVVLVSIKPCVPLLEDFVIPIPPNIYMTTGQGPRYFFLGHHPSKVVVSWTDAFDVLGSGRGPFCCRQSIGWPSRIAEQGIRTCTRQDVIELTMNWGSTWSTMVEQ